MDSNWGAGSDYSMILHAVEDGITDVINVSDSDGNDDKEESVDVEESLMSTSNNMQLELQIDDIKLKNEELRDKLLTQNDEFTREREKYIRQLQFLENENVSAKKDLASRTEKYFETKKKLQAVVRAAEADKKKYEAQLSEASQASKIDFKTTSKKAGFDQREQQQDDRDTFNRKLADFEDKVIEKSNEAKNLAIKNAELQEECTNLQQQLLVARSEAGDEEDLKNMKRLQAQVRELEFSLRQKNREFDKLQKSAKNSHVLEESLSDCNSKISSLQESVKNYRLMEQKYALLVEEKKSWSIHFQDLIKNSEKSELVDDKKQSTREPSVTPVVILRLLSDMQSKCATMLRDKGLLENEIADLKISIRRCEVQVQQKDLDLNEKTSKVKQLENSNTLLRQQARLYEGEVMSLRSLLKTFDSEILILGNKKKRSRASMESEKALQLDTTDEGSSGADVSVLLKLKNEEIDKLREELDQQRISNNTVLKSLINGEKQSSGKSTTSDHQDEDMSLEAVELKKELSFFKIKYEALKEDMYMFQKATGLDFVPETTKVLHLKENPSLLRYQALGDASMQVDDSCSKKEDTPMRFLTPLDELKHFKNSVRTGKLVPPSSKSTLEDEKRSRSDSASNTSSGLDTSVSLNASRANVSVSSSGIDSQKMNQRLKEVFREKIAEYREAVYLLFGYKVDLMPADSITGETGTSMLKLRSMYAESPDDSLKFIQRKDRDGLEILETPFATGLDDSIMLSLKSSNSVPVFLSEITLDLFGKQTFIG